MAVALSRVRGLKRLPHEAFTALGEGRTLTSAWIETGDRKGKGDKRVVALSRVRGLKPEPRGRIDEGRQSHSHECVD